MCSTRISGFLFFVLLLLAALTGKSQSRLDSLQHIKEVKVTGSRIERDVIPVQQLQGEELKKLSAHSVADAIRYFSGVQIKDYGGIGGLKTVNIRSMGSQHVGVF
ncbi:MAG: TonB-dependent receptor [Mangrovibacterium sp.]